MEKAVKTFLSTPRFAVAGASPDPKKFGNKIFVWYLQHNLPVTPMNPSVKSLKIEDKRRSVTDDYATVASPSAISSPTQTALSVITPPAVTRKLLEEAKKAGVPAVWLQPGSFDSDILEYARKEWPDAAVGGTDVPGSRSGQGWCVLADGDRGLMLAGRADYKQEPSKL